MLIELRMIYLGQVISQMLHGAGFTYTGDVLRANWIWYIWIWKDTNMVYFFLHDIHF